MIVSLALLGFGASGSFLALFPGLGAPGLDPPRRSVGNLALACGLSMPGAYLLTNYLPFNSYSLAWDLRQAGVLILHYLALATPFFFSGLAVSLLLAGDPQNAGRTYAANLSGSALGCALALAAPFIFGGEGTVMLCSALAGLASLLCIYRPAFGNLGNTAALAGAAALLLLAGLDLGLRLDDQRGLAFLELKLSPYKGLSYALQPPGSRVVYRRWNAAGRVDRVASPAIHSLPGLSYRYLEPLPSMDGLLVDGDDLSVVPPPESAAQYAAHLPLALALELRPQARVLALEPRGGLDLLTALALGAGQVTAVELNPLVVEAAPEIYALPGLEVIVEDGRSFLRRTQDKYDVIVLSLASGYHPVGSGAYSLAEEYRYTLEAFQDARARLAPEGLLLVTRWLQDPPSESLRTFALAVEALEVGGQDPRPRLVAFRGYNTGTLLLKNEPFQPDELQALRAFAAGRAYDLVYAPDLQPEETNRYNVLREPVYAQTFCELLESRPRDAFYSAYPYNVRPPSDDRPFMGHYFKWSQAGEVLARLGRTWQPFGGAGYFVILILLAAAVLLAAVLILLPVAARRGPSPGEPASNRRRIPVLLYFGWIGLAFLLVEIPLLQRFILYLGQPAYALTAVLFSLLLFSALGSRFSAQLSLRLVLPLLFLLLLLTPGLLQVVFQRTLGLTFSLRLGLTILLLAPVGFLMGVPFPAGLRWLAGGQAAGEGARDASALIPWAWAVNGSASVVAANLAALLALSFGFSWVFRLGALCYLGAWITALAFPRQGRFRSRRR